MAASSRFSSAVGLLLIACATGGACIIHEGGVPEPPGMPPPLAHAADTRSTADIVAGALPAVVLLIDEHPAAGDTPAHTTFGAGFLTRDNLVVTSLHVIEGEGKVSAMLYKPGRQSYTPMDGGLMRFLFENQSDLVPVERVSTDSVTDLAVLRVDADTSSLPKLVWSNEDVRPGDRVLALGHPQETVWSFSEGVVGALQYGIVQHTAIVGPGSSGGPLLNAKGEVVGVNVAKVMNQPTGLSFARPISMVASTFSDKKVASPLDQSTPAAAALSCWRAQELALSDTAECFDWEREWADYKSVAEEARRLATTDEVKGKIDSCHLGPQAKSAWTAMAREHAIHVFDPDYQKAKMAEKAKNRKPQPTDADEGSGDEESADKDSGDKDSASKDSGNKTSAGKVSLDKDAGDEDLTDKDSGGDESSPEICVSPQTPADKGFVADFKNPQKLAERLRNGLRVEQTQMVGADVAWVLLASRGADGSVAQFTELYGRVDNRWVQRMSPSPSEMASLPKGWPAPIMTFASKKPLYIASILREAATMVRCPFGPKATDAAASASPGGSGRAVLRLGF